MEKSLLKGRIKLYCADCMDILKTIPDKTIDLILTDPPYGVSRCAWDKPVDLAMLWQEFRRIITPIGVVCLFGTEPFSTHVRMAAIDIYKYDWIWHKDRITGHTHAKNMPMRLMKISAYSLLLHLDTLFN